MSYTNGAQDVGEICDDKTVTRDDDPDLNAVELHVSCSDDLSNPKKSDLGGLTAAEWSIVKHDGKTCDQDDPKGKGDKDKKDDKCIAYDFLYTNGERDTGEFCDGNTVTRDDDPDLNAVELHISCSDDFSDPANPKKSDLGGLVVDQFSIIKHDGKTCDSPIEEPEQTITFTCDTVTVTGTIPVQSITLIYAGDTTEVVDLGGATSFVVTAATGHVIEAIIIDGAALASDAVDCGPGDILEVTFDCTSAVITATAGVGTVTIEFSDGTTLVVDGGATTQITVDGERHIESVTVGGELFFNGTTGCGYGYP